MKRLLLITALITVLIVPYGYAQMGQGMMRGQGMMGQGQQQYTPAPQQGGYYDCPMHGPGMSGYGGYGMRGMGPGMMGHHEMMHGGGMGYGGFGYGMGPGRMGGYGYRGYDPETYKKYQEQYLKNLEETAGLRKELHNKRFDYFEALRNPKTTRESLLNIEKEIWELQKKIQEKWYR